uniref:Rab-GAP TBC domain-containing protein n=1 Tax=Globodera pallida TaxID=36090 RepID=A0A183CG71_GLOPA
MRDSETRPSNFASAAEVASMTRTCGGNSSFTAASITRKAMLLPNGGGSGTKEQQEQQQQGRSVENLNALLLKTRVNDSRTLIRNFSQRVKSQVQCSLSEPLKGLGERLAAVEQRRLPQPQQQQQQRQSSSPQQRQSSSPQQRQSSSPQMIRCSNNNSKNINEQPESLQSSPHYRRHRAMPSSSASPMKRSSSVRRCVSALSSRLLQQLADDDEGDDEPPEPPQAFAGTAASTSEDSFEEDQEFLELQEREQIVDKYERGPDQKDVDPWENPDFELYRITDRYGFMHKKLTLEQTEEQKRVHKELRREQKWLRMLKEWEQRHPAKLAERMWKGVPDTLRLVIWKRLIGADVMKANSRDNLYNELLARARLVSKDIKQIDLDINRTYRDNLAFRRRYDVKQRSLFNVLTAYAMLNTEVGYCQGMSQIAALFLMYMDEEEAFWSLHGLLVNRKYGMHGFFVPGFPKLQRFQNHYDKDNMGIPPIYLTKWWFGCFLDRVPFPLALRLWDVFLYFGESILIAMAYNIVKMHRSGPFLLAL